MRLQVSQGSHILRESIVVLHYSPPHHLLFKNRSTLICTGIVKFFDIDYGQTTIASCTLVYTSFFQKQNLLRVIGHKKVIFIVRELWVTSEESRSRDNGPRTDLQKVYTKSLKRVFEDGRRHLCEVGWDNKQFQVGQKELWRAPLRKTFKINFGWRGQNLLLFLHLYLVLLCFSDCCVYCCSIDNCNNVTATHQNGKCLHDPPTTPQPATTDTSNVNAIASTPNCDDCGGAAIVTFKLELMLITFAMSFSAVFLFN